MTILTFPSNPQSGDHYSGPNSVVYVYDGVKWIAQSTTITGAQVTNFVQDSVAPIFTNIQGNGIAFTYDSNTNTLTANVHELPSQTGHTNKFLKTDGSALSWDDGPAGPAGPQGPRGFTGPQGLKGDQGDPGATGLKGDKGDPGNTGATGATGQKGNTGDPGPTGAQGDPGPRGLTGAQGISVTLQGTKATISDLPLTGNPGDAWIVTTGDGGAHLDGSLWFWNISASRWDDIGKIVGPQGDIGNPGPRGLTGPPGNNGQDGAPGAAGANGADGLDGISFIWKSTWNGGGYNPNDVVEYQGSTYIATVYNEDTQPTDTNYWALMTARGEVGPQGPGADQGLNTSDNVQFVSAKFTNGDDVYGPATLNQLAFEWTGGGFPHYIRTRHNSDNYGNAIDFLTSDGTVGSDNPILGLSVESGVVIVRRDIHAQGTNDLNLKVFNSGEGGTTISLQNRNFDTGGRNTQFEVAPTLIRLTTDFDVNQYQWEFGNDGTLSTPDRTTVIKETRNGTNFTLKIQGKDEGDQFGFITSQTPGYGVEFQSLNAAASAYAPFKLRGSEVNIQSLNGDTPSTWTFSNNGILGLPLGDDSLAIIQTTGTIRLNANGSLWDFKANGDLAGPYFTLPGSAGSAGQVLVNDGSGNLTWQNQSGGGGGGSTDRLTNGSYNFILGSDGKLSLPADVGSIGFYGMGWPGFVSNNGYLSIVGNSANQDYLGQELSQIFLADNSNQGIVDIITRDVVANTMSTWRFNAGGILTLPNDNYLETTNSNLAMGSQGAVIIRSNAADNINDKTWTFGANGNLTVPGNIVPNADNAYDLGSSTHQWRHVYVSTGSIYLGNVKLSTQNNQLNIEHVTNIGGDTVLYPVAIKSVNISNTAPTVQDSGLWFNNQTKQMSVGVVNQWVDINLIPISNTAPEGANGTLWFNSTDARMYVKYMGQWIDTNPAVIPQASTYLGELDITETTISNKDYTGSTDIVVENAGKSWRFAPEGGLVFPDMTVQTTAYTTAPILEIDGGDASSVYA